MVKRQPDPPRATASFSHSLVTLCSSRSSVSSAPFLLPLSRSLSLSLPLSPSLPVPDRFRIVLSRQFLLFHPKERSSLDLAPFSLSSNPSPSPLSRPPLPSVPHSSSIQPREYPRRGPLSPPPFRVTECTFGGERCSRQGFSRHAPEKKISCRAGRGLGGRETDEYSYSFRFHATERGEKKEKDFHTTAISSPSRDPRSHETTGNHLFVSFSLSLVQLRRIPYIYIY